MTAAGYLWQAWCEHPECNWKGQLFRGAYGGRASADEEAVKHAHWRRAAA